MKRITTLILALAIAVCTAMAGSRTIPASDLPRAAQLLIEKTYGKNVIHHARVDSKFLNAKEYDVVLKDGTEIEFDENGALRDVEGGAKGVPDALLPEAIRDYVKRYFPGQKVHSLEVKSSGYEVDLGSGVEIEFDKAGRFKKVDR